LLADEAGNTAETAAALCSGAFSCSPSNRTAGYTSAIVHAVLNSADDRDFFSFTATAAGSVTIRVDYTPLWVQKALVSAGAAGTLSLAKPHQRCNLRLDLNFAADPRVQQLIKPQPNPTDESQTFTATVGAAGEHA
jgi:hypothetical protein